MSSFRFPPPPPPPPKASSNDNQPSHASQRGGYSNQTRPEGSRGRGGSQRGAARGSGGNLRGGGPGNLHGRGGRGGYHSNRGNPSHRGGSEQWRQSGMPVQSNALYAPSLANGAYVNPPFTTAPLVDPNTLVQAMSSMVTSAGTTTLDHRVNSMGSSPYAQPSQNQQTPQPPRWSPTQQSGQKRKWDDHQNNAHAKPQLQRKSQQSSKPPRAKAAVPPAVPGFGFTLPMPPSAPVPPKSHKLRDNRKGKVRLGLAHYDEKPEESSEEEEEDVDEEAALGEKLKGGGYAFEHEGEHISLQTAGDIAEWIKDRRRNFPTYQKALEKAQARTEKRNKELEFVRRLRGKPPQPEVERIKPVAKTQERSQRDDKKQEELAALRKKLHESMVKKEAPTTVDLGLGYGSATESEGESSILSESSVVSSSEESLDESGDESEDSDAPPEATSSKIAPLPIKVPPAPVPSQAQQKPGKGKLCNTWKQHGRCPYGDSCRYKHPRKEEKRTGLYEKLVEQELVKSDQLALEAIKYLGEHGFLG